MSGFPPIASLRSLEAVARLGSVTRAAKELCVTHSAISQQIKQLEELIGVRLFIRHGRGLQINEAGRLYALHIRDALSRISDATRLVQVNPRKSELTIATVPSFGNHWLTPRLQRFRQLHPHITLRLTVSLTVNDIAEHPSDIVIRMGNGDWQGVECRYLFGDELIVVASPTFNGGRLPATPEDVAESQIIFSSESWKTWCSSAGLGAEILPAGLCINDSNLVLEAVRRGQGIALERRTLVQDALLRGELVQLTRFRGDYPWSYWRVTPLHAEKPAEVALFNAWLDEEVAAWKLQQQQLLAQCQQDPSG